MLTTPVWLKITQLLVDSITHILVTQVLNKKSIILKRGLSIKLWKVSRSASRNKTQGKTILNLVRLTHRKSKAARVQGFQIMITLRITTTILENNNFSIRENLLLRHKHSKKRTSTPNDKRNYYLLNPLTLRIF